MTNYEQFLSHAAGVMNDGILRRQVFSGATRHPDTED